MSSKIALHSVRFAVLAGVTVTLATLTGCSSGINTMSAPSTATRMSHYADFPIDDPAPATAGSHMPIIGRGYGYMGG